MDEPDMDTVMKKELTWRHNRRTESTCALPATKFTTLWTIPRVETHGMSEQEFQDLQCAQDFAICWLSSVFFYIAPSRDERHGHGTCDALVVSQNVVEEVTFRVELVELECVQAPEVQDSGGRACGRLLVLWRSGDSDWLKGFTMAPAVL